MSTTVASPAEVGVQGVHRMIGHRGQRQVHAGEYAVAVGHLHLADRGTEREQLHAHARELDLDDRDVARVGSLAPGADGHEPLKAVSTTARAACCTCARCSGPRKDSA